MVNDIEKDTSLFIRKREITYDFRNENIYKLHFYEKNPRIATILAEHQGDITDNIIDDKLWNRLETHKLKRRIEKDGGLIHPIVVYRDKVIEGNTRLCCYRHLHDETKDEKWENIKCHVITDNLSQDEIYRLLCTEHIEGKIDWEAYEKAYLFCKMKEEENMTLDQISEIVGESAPSVSYKIRAYKLMANSGVMDKSKYSHFEQLVLNPDIREIKKRQDINIETKVVELIKEGKIKKAHDIRKIGDIYKRKEARKRLFNKRESIDQIYHDLKAKAPMTGTVFM
ncbi:MAG: hypothetical protein NT076_03590, partial [Candidatus Pacearchaeota archaeon]|nr:hypothetical protein [Candidatus Pacearchaeota archaeon]